MQACCVPHKADMCRIKQAGCKRSPKECRQSAPHSSASSQAGKGWPLMAGAHPREGALLPSAIYLRGRVLTPCVVVKEGTAVLRVHGRTSCARGERSGNSAFGRAQRAGAAVEAGVGADVYVVPHAAWGQTVKTRACERMRRRHLCICVASVASRSSSASPSHPLAPGTSGL